MNKLLDIRTNIYYVKSKDKDGEEKYSKCNELVFLIGSPDYLLNNQSAIVRQEKITEMRFVVDEKVFQQMIEILEKLKGSKEEDLT